MSEAEKKSRWRHLWRAFRWLRILCWLVVLAAVAGGIYLNQVGLPGFVKRRVQAELRANGLDVEFERLRLRWYEGIVAEKVTLTRTNQSTGPQLSLAEAKVGVDGDALRQFQFKITSVWLRQGRLAWPLAASNLPPRVVTIENVGTELRFLPDDRWELDHFKAETLGMKLRMSGAITNASVLRERRISPPGPDTPPGDRPGSNLETQLLRWLAELDKVQFTLPPELTVTLHGDGRPGGGFSADVSATVAGARTPWGQAGGLSVNGRLMQAAGTNSPLSSVLAARIGRLKTEWGVASNTIVSLTWTQATNSPPVWDADWQTSLSAVKSPWATAERASASGRTTRRAETPNEVATTLTLDASALKTDWGTAQAVSLTGRAAGTITNQVLLGAEGTVTLTAPETRWGKAASARVRGKIAPQPEGFQRKSDASWAAWTNLEPWQIDYEVALDTVSATNLAVGKFSAAGQWRAPELAITNLHVTAFGGRADGTLQLNVATRRVEAGGALDCDAHLVAPLLHPADQRFIAQFTWDQPPKFTGRAGITLGAWTNALAEWERELLPTLWVQARADCGPGAFRTVPWLTARTAVNISNVVIELPDLFVRRPEGTAELSHRAHLLGRFFHWKGRSGIDPQAIRPLIEDKGTLEVLAALRLTQPPEVVGEVWGEHARGEPERIGVSARVAVTNFAFRGEGWSNLSAAVNFTNDMVFLKGVDLRRGGQQRLTAPEVWVDVMTQTLRVTNVLSTLDPVEAVRVIGPETSAAIAPYRFTEPPTIRVNGSIQLNTTDTVDLHFDIEGGAFTWEKFRLPRIRGGVHWVTNQLTLTDIIGEFYGGRVESNARFDFAPNGEADYRFRSQFTEANLNRLIADLADPTNKLEGTFTGVLDITAANTANFTSWQGSGHVALTNGLLWNFPLFGLFSPALNAIIPGLGNSRAKDATATFTITNGVIVTRDLEIRSPPVRLHYDGIVGFDGRVKAQVEAELFRDTLLVGRLVSLLTTPLTKVFEYKVSGTLTDPKSEPVFFAKLLLFPLRPFKTLKELFPGLGEPTKQPGKK